MRLIPTAVTNAVKEELSRNTPSKAHKARLAIERAIEMDREHPLEPINIPHGYGVTTVTLNFEDSQAEFIEEYARRNYTNRSRAACILLMYGLNQQN